MNRLSSIRRADSFRLYLPARQPRRAFPSSNHCNKYYYCINNSSRAMLVLACWHFSRSRYLIRISPVFLVTDF